MKNIRIQVRPSMRDTSDYWAVEKWHISHSDGKKIYFTVHNVRWFKNKRLAVSWARKNNPKNYPIKVGWL